MYRGITKWQLSSSNAICIPRSDGKHFMATFSQEKHLSCCKFPAPGKVWLVRSRMSPGSRRDYGGEHEGESLIPCCNRFQQRLEFVSPRCSPVMVKLTAICFLIFLLTFWIFKRWSRGEQPQPAHSQTQGLQVYIQVHPRCDLKPVASSLPPHQTGLYLPKSPLLRFLPAITYKTLLLLWWRMKTRRANPDFFHEKIPHRHFLPTPAAALLTRMCFRGTNCLDTGGNLDRNCGARAQHATQQGSR